MRARVEGGPPSLATPPPANSRAVANGRARAFVGAVLAAIGAVSGCEESVPSPKEVPHVDGGIVCCPIDAPSCNCPRTGGSPDARGRCSSGLCDAPPPSFTLTVDGNGCPVYVVSSAGSCAAVRPDDAGDEGFSPPADAASSDAQPDAIADAGGD